MATPAQNIEILNNYFDAGGDLTAVASAGTLPAGLVTGQAIKAMRELVLDASWDKSARAAFALASIFEKTLSPPNLVPDRFVAPAVQIAMLEGIHSQATGGFWSPPEPSGITEWLGSEAGGRAYFLSALTSGPRIIDGHPVVMPGDVLGWMLKIVRDVALPASWFAPMLEQDIFRKFEVRISGSTDGPAMRRALLALNSQAAGRVTSELAKLATTQPGAFPSFPTGELMPGGSRALAPTPAPPTKPWWRNGWAWIAGGAGAVGGGMLARR